MLKYFKPTILVRFGLPKTKSMATILVKEKLNRYACFKPRINNTKLEVVAPQFYWWMLRDTMQDIGKPF